MMTDNEIADGNVDFKDRSTGLIVFGVLQVVLGALCALAVPLMLLAMVVAASARASAAGGPGAIAMLPGLIAYVLLSVWFIWMGIGSIKARRWARALTLVTSSFWLIAGVAGLVFFLFMFPDMYSHTKTGARMPLAVAATMRAVITIVLGVIYILIPGTLVLFYGSRHVRLTCEWKDPTVRWTDRCPLPVLAVSIVSGIWALCLPLAGLHRWTVPFFGTVQSGVAGAAIVSGSLLLLCYVAWGMYRLKLSAWWCSLLLVSVWGLAAMITFARVDPMAYFQAMDLPPDQLELMGEYMGAWGPGMVTLSIVYLGATLAYLIFIRRYFPRGGEDRA